MAFEIREALGGIDQLHHCMDQRDGPEQDEEQTNNDDRTGALFHAEETNASVFVCKATRRHPGPVMPHNHRPQTRTTEEFHLPP